MYWWKRKEARAKKDDDDRDGVYPETWFPVGPAHTQRAHECHKRSRSPSSGLAHLWMLVGVALLICLSYNLASAVKGGGIGVKGLPYTSTGLNIVQIPRLKKGDLTVPEFFEKYGDMPVIIEGEVSEHPFIQLGMGFESIADICGSSLIDTVVYSASSVTWAGHKDQILMPVNEFIHNYILHNTSSEVRYGHSHHFGLPQFCPRLGQYMPVPKLGSKRLPKWGTYTDLAQPTLFMGTANTKSELHADGGLLPFWLSVYVGSKTFRIIRFEDGFAHVGAEVADLTRLGRSVYDADLNKFVEKRLEIWEPDVSVFPELSNLPVYEGTAYAGDLLYLPSGALHGVFNEEASFCSTSNEFYPPILPHYIDVCYASEFDAGCDENLENVYGDLCPLKEHPTPDTFTSCVEKSKLLQFIRSYYDSNSGFIDIPQYFSNGRESYESWCNDACTALQQRSDTALEDLTEALNGGTATDYPQYLDDYTKSTAWAFFKVWMQNKLQYKSCSSQCTSPDLTSLA